MQVISYQVWPAFLPVPDLAKRLSELHVRMTWSPEHICKRTSGFKRSSGNVAQHYLALL